MAPKALRHPLKPRAPDPPPLPPSTPPAVRRRIQKLGKELAIQMLMNQILKSRLRSLRCRTTNAADSLDAAVTEDDERKAFMQSHEKELRDRPGPYPPVQD
jgi:hypothetical protein